MKRQILLAIGLVALGAGAAWADPAFYALTGMGTGVAGTSKCATYQITIDLAVEGLDERARSRPRPMSGTATRWM